MSLQGFHDRNYINAFGMTKEQAIAKGICVICLKEAAPRIYSEAGQREYKISACCEACFDEMFREEDNE